MTTKRDRKQDAKKADRPKLKKETLKDLRTESNAEAVRGGRAEVNCTTQGRNSC